MGAQSPLLITTDWDGRQVVLLSAHWLHICEKHPDLFPRFGSQSAILNEIEKTVATPDEVRGDPERSYVAYAYRKVSPHLELSVIIWYIGAGRGEIQTAHLASRRRKWEVPVWP